jgi:tetratricopeptide (TPR) repeat protein
MNRCYTAGILLVLAAVCLSCGGCSWETPSQAAADRGDASPVDAGSAAGKGGESPGRGEKTPFSGSKSCRDCHAEFYGLWSTSHHGLAMQPYTPALAKAKLAPQADDVAIGKDRYRAEIGERQGWVRQQGPGGEKKYPIAHVMGGKNVYYFLTPLEHGRLQVLPLAYDVHKKAWYDTAGSGVRHFPDRRDEALHWTDRMFTFNTTCFNCHVSQLRTNYDLAADAYRTTWAEPGIGCESCHGPAGAHVRAMEAGEKGRTSREIKIIRTKEFAPPQMNDMCATCHAKLAPMSTSFVPGEKFFDHFDLLCLEHPDFYPDGRDLGENYTFTSWLMSPCATAGKLDCNHCHTPSGRMRFEGPKSNRQCLPCHAEQVEKPAEHSRHEAGTKGSECVACHMPMTRFAAMNRSDHSMRPPAPAATMAFKSPNACNACHADKDAAWSDAWVRKWHAKDYQAEVLRRGRLIDAARKQQWKQLPEMLGALQKKGDAVYKASLVRLLRGCTDGRQWPVLRGLLADPSPLVRSSAAAALSDRLTPESVAALLAATGDESRLVRIRAALALASVPSKQVTDDQQRKSLARATQEFFAAMKARPDDWSSYANVGNFCMEREDYAAAVQQFEIAYRLEPRQIGPMVNAAVAYSSLQENDKAEESLRRALKHEPDNAGANFNLGLLLGEKRDLPGAEAALRKAIKVDPQMAAAAYNLGLVLAHRNKLDEAVEWCEKAQRLRPGEPRYVQALLSFYQQKRDPTAAADVLRRFLQAEPTAWEAYLLLGSIYEGLGDVRAAAAVYRAALKQPGLPAEFKTQFDAKLKAAESG